ncbi:MAG: hypothetical protein HC872_08415, partial [Gammaproteobacteria bacterium]|nr:hypothetical protein [Gammaproteobacteria bacterium]
MSVAEESARLRPPGRNFVMLFNSQNIVAWHDRNTAEHISRRDQLAAQGFSPISLSIYGEPTDPRYAAVMVKRAQPIATHSMAGLSSAACEKNVRADGGGGFRPLHHHSHRCPAERGIR